MLRPAIDDMRVMQERVASPSMCTVQAPQSAWPQPNFVPVSPSVSRSTQSNGVSGDTSTECGWPLTVIEIASIFFSRVNFCVKRNSTFRLREMQFVFSDSADRQAKITVSRERAEKGKIRWKRQTQRSHHERHHIRSTVCRRRQHR